ncbi:MAG: hypothetical protein AMJ72_02720 [Acidithiobacillales bacterium SM1_46]|nr:MAG: hypothetical protein AMJ72_02720 [Acidithiobacillales bacterium SM1_46]
MELYIQIRDGQPFEHPIMGENFRQAFPDVDTENLPEGFARFVRHAPNVSPDTYQVLVENYVWNGNVVEDSWSVRDMTQEERAAYDAEYGPAPDVSAPGSAPDVVG